MSYSNRILTGKSVLENGCDQDKCYGKFEYLYTFHICEQ